MKVSRPIRALMVREQGCNNYSSQKVQAPWKLIEVRSMPSRPILRAGILRRFQLNWISASEWNLIGEIQFCSQWCEWCGKIWKIQRQCWRQRHELTLPGRTGEEEISETRLELKIFVRLEPNEEEEFDGTFCYATGSQGFARSIIKMFSSTVPRY